MIVTEPAEVIEVAPDETSVIPKRRRGRPTLGDEELLDKSLDQFLRNGFDGTSMEGVAAATGVAKRTLYKRYGDKLSLFKAALKQAIDKWIVPIERLQAVECEDLERTLIEIGTILVLNVMSAEGLQLLRITNIESVRIPEIGTYTFNEGTERTIAYLTELFRRRADEFSLNTISPDAAADAFISLVISGPAERAAWGAPIDEDNLCRRTRTCVKLFLDGVRAHGTVASPDTRQEHGEAFVTRVGDLGEISPSDQAERVASLEEENRKLRLLLVDALLKSVDNTGGN